MDTRVAHCFQQRKAADYIIAVVFAWIGNGFPNVGKGCKVHHRVRSMFRHDFIETASVEDITAFKRPPLHRPFMAVREIVIDDWQVACGCQCLARMRADIARTAGDQDCLFAAHRDYIKKRFEAAVTACLRSFSPRSLLFCSFVGGIIKTQVADMQRFRPPASAIRTYREMLFDFAGPPELGSRACPAVCIASSVRSMNCAKAITGICINESFPRYRTSGEIASPESCT